MSPLELFTLLITRGIEKQQEIKLSLSYFIDNIR